METFPHITNVSYRNMNMDYDPQKYKSRWLGYFDLLGTSDLIRSGKISDIFFAYQDALEHLSSWKERHPNVSHAWFSDTFIIFSEEDSAESFAEIEMVCRWFVFSLIRKNIPVRGSLSCGQFYVDMGSSLFLGEALLEAYEWGENQDWLGMLLCPTTVRKLEDFGLPVAERLNYAKYDVPFKKEPKTGSSEIAACILGEWMQLSNGENALLKNFREMLSQQTDFRVIAKYKRTIEFIEKNHRTIKK